jgi:hypothetical protein
VVAIRTTRFNILKLCILPSEWFLCSLRSHNSAGYLNTINGLIFVAETKCVSCEVRTIFYIVRRRNSICKILMKYEEMFAFLYYCEAFFVIANYWHILNKFLNNWILLWRFLDLRSNINYVCQLNRNSTLFYSTSVVTLFFLQFRHYYIWIRSLFVSSPFCICLPPSISSSRVYFYLIASVREG